MSEEMRNETRTKAFQRNEELEMLLESLNSTLSQAEQVSLDNFTAPRYPLILIMGGPRSGTTLLLQWLAASGHFGYPSNLLARFYRAPRIGAMIQEMLLNPRYRYREDFADLQPYGYAHSFSSDLGKTEGLAAPNVFWYFWRRFFDFGERPFLDETKWQQANSRDFVRELAAMEAVFDKPFVMKGIIANWNVAQLNALFEHVLFIHVRREPAQQINSILKARERFRGDRKLWWGFKTPEFDSLEFDSAEAEIAAQIFFTRRALSQAFEQLPSERWLEVDYELFCENPAATYQQICERLERQRYSITDAYQGPEKYRNNNQSVNVPLQHLDAVYRKLVLEYTET
ncbi:MAG: sulfotransferase [Candidatus Thiodiazotropha sp.]